jgi:Carbohydrate-binding family 9
MTAPSLNTHLKDEADSGYRVKRSSRLNAEVQALDLDWAGDLWQPIEALTIDQFLPESSDHRPLTELKLQYTEDGIYGLFRAQDRYIRCTQTRFQDRVCRDSCVEIYFLPRPENIPAGRSHASYINLEISGNGTLLSYHIRDSEREGDAFRDYDELSAAQGRRIQIESTLPRRVFPEIETELEWRLGFFLPFEVLEECLSETLRGAQGVRGQRWRMNAFKCTEDSSHPHWASWQPCSTFNFHLPEDFGWLVFE